MRTHGLKELLGQAFAASHGTYGAPRLQVELAEVYDLHVSRKRVARLMRELSIAGVSRRGRRRVVRIAGETPAAAGPRQASLHGHGTRRALGGRHHVIGQSGGPLPMVTDRSP